MWYVVSTTKLSKLHLFFFQLSQIDLQCINSLLTMEHLSLMCQEKNYSFSVDTSGYFNRQTSSNAKTAIRKNSKSNLLDSPNMPESE